MTKKKNSNKRETFVFIWRIIVTILSAIGTAFGVEQL